MNQNYNLPVNVKKAAVVMMQYDYGILQRGYSFEYVNIYMPLCDILGKENVQLFDFYSDYKKSGKQKMNEKLADFIKAEKPDFTLFCLFEDEMDENIISSLREYTKTIVCFFDDPWRVKFVRHWIGYFDYFTTSDYYMMKTYESDNILNAIHIPFGFNSSIYLKKDIGLKYDVSFVGGFSPLRKWIVNQLLKEGIKVNVFGRGWGSSIQYLPIEKMVDVFNQTSVNLNLSNGISRDVGLLTHSIMSPRALKHILFNKKNKEQVKGRHFEINGCGAFQLSYFVPGLNLYYEIDKQIAVYEDIYSLPAEIKFFLKRKDLREEIATSGYLRSMQEHSAQGYLAKLIKSVF